MPKTRKYYFMDYSQLIAQAKNVKNFLDSNKDGYEEFHYRQFSRCIKPKLFHQPKTMTTAQGKRKFLRTSLINNQAFVTLKKCLTLLQQLDFIKDFEFESLPRQDSYVIKIEFGQQQADFDDALNDSEYFPIKGLKQQLSAEFRQTIDEHYNIDYQAILADSQPLDYQAMAAKLAKLLPDLWHDSYDKMTKTETFVQHIPREFSLLFDLQAENPNQTESDFIEDRVVVFYGLSKQSEVKRDASRMAGYMRNVFNWTDKDTDKGHFIGHSLGGGVDENLFPQKKHINRGQSARGKVYRAMESYCAANPATFCFSRPIYGDFSTRPFVLEYGVLKQDGHLWIEQFDNV